jgi:hypothetical protein
MVIEHEVVPTTVIASMADSENGKVPGTVGVPVMTPSIPIVRPVGSDPDPIAKV